jgi:glycosyltransferase involved in cell wall biosynthesis
LSEIPSARAKLVKNQNPLISVVTVVLNGRNKIEKSIESVSRQQYGNIQHIVIDGGSTDGTIDFLKEHESEVAAWLSEPDAGISDAFNKGIRLAKGELVGILNAGDWYEPDTLTRIAEAYRLHPEIDVFCGAICLKSGSGSDLVCQSAPLLIDKETSVYHPTVFVKRSAYERFGMFDVDYRVAMDYELLLRFKRQGGKFLSLEYVLANMTLDGLSFDSWSFGLKEVRKARSKYFPYHNVAYHYLSAVMKNLVARGLNKIGLTPVYHAYWRLRNEGLRIHVGRPT